MKPKYILPLLILCTNLIFAQNKDKIKGNKIILKELKNISNFDQVLIDDNFEVYFQKAEQNNILVEADENLHPIIGLDITDNKLYIHATKEISSYKKLMIVVYYTPNLKSIQAKNQAIAYAIEDLVADDIALTANDNAKLLMNILSKKCNIVADDKAKLELNIKVDSLKLELNKFTSCKALLVANDFKCDMYQKTKANIEGESQNAWIRMDNDATFYGEKFDLKSAYLVAEGYSNISINSSENLKVAASGYAEVDIFGKPKLDVITFSDQAKLIKKEKR